jgi:SM-20-related protein
MASLLPPAVPLLISVLDMAEIAHQLEHRGYIVLENPLLLKLLDELRTRCQDDGLDRFHTAQVGRGTDKSSSNSIRGDVISWLEQSDLSDMGYLDWMESLRVGLNAALYLGLFDYECHYAIYGPGTGYAKHLDVLQGKKNRILSTVLYLNQDWQSNDGGELDVYDASGENVIATVQPTYGTMIIFLSETSPHAVRISNTTRRSIAGWFRVSGS